MDEQEFNSMRERWLDHVVGMVKIPKALRASATDLTPALTAPELALVMVHVGLSHLMGADRDEAALGEFCDAHLAAKVVGTWRIGRDLVQVAGEAHTVWTTLWHLGLWTGGVRPELSLQIGTSFLAREFKSSPPGPDIAWSLWQNVIEVPTAPLEAVDEIWDCEGSHLAPMWAVEPLTPALLTALTPLELLALTGARREPRMEAVLDEALRTIELHLSVPGAWGGPSATAVPDWFRDYVVTLGGRILQERAGLVPCWFFVVETEDELRAFQRWRYSERRIGVVTEVGGPAGELSMQLELEFDDGGPPAQLRFFYNTRNWDAATALDVLAWVGIVRMEVYSVATGTLEYAFSLGVRFPDVRDELSDPELRLFPEQVTSFSRYTTNSGEVLSEMRNSERVQFELVRRGEKARLEGPPEVTEAYERYLGAVDAASRSQCVGVTPDVISIEWAKRALVVALGFTEPAVDDIALDALEARQVFVQVQYVSSWPPSVKANVARLQGGVGVARSVTLAESEPGTGNLVPDEEGWALLAETGVNAAILSPSGPLYASGLHEDFLDSGFDEVSFVHRSTVLASRPPAPSTADGVLLAGYAGTPLSRGFLVSMAREFDVVQDAYGCDERPWLYGVALPEVVHLAGHGSTGNSVADYWLRATESVEDLVTPARVLLEVDASATSLVFLSACSSGRGEFTPNSVMEAIPLDVAFLERGAACVISTAAPVNDVVAAVFAGSFHVCWAAGASVWEAYQEARSAASGRGCSREVAEALRDSWSSWRDELARASVTRPDDWSLFRVSGRHWN